MQSIKFESKINTAGGKITCPRCQALSKRTMIQCGKPALKGKSVCQLHGGRSTGPITEVGKAKQKAAVTKSGNYTKESSDAQVPEVHT